MLQIIEHAAHSDILPALRCSASQLICHGKAPLVIHPTRSRLRRTILRTHLCNREECPRLLFHSSKVSFAPSEPISGVRPRARARSSATYKICPLSITLCYNRCMFMRTRMDVDGM